MVFVDCSGMFITRTHGRTDCMVYSRVVRWAMSIDFLVFRAYSGLKGGIISLINAFAEVGGLAGCILSTDWFV